VLISSLSIGPNGLIAELVGACTHILQSVSARTLLPVYFVLFTGQAAAGPDVMLKGLLAQSKFFFKINALQV
jgi:hypothetical protein